MHYYVGSTHTLKLNKSGRFSFLSLFVAKKNTYLQQFPQYHRANKEIVIQSVSSKSFFSLFSVFLFNLSPLQ